MDVLEKRSARALKLLSDCNNILARAETETTLLLAVCRLIVDTSGYVMAWIGLAEHDVRKTVEPVARWKRFRIPRHHLCFLGDQIPEGRWPDGEVHSGGQVQINRDFQATGMTPWREASAQRRFHLSIALPLSNVDGVLVR